MGGPLSSRRRGRTQSGMRRGGSPLIGRRRQPALQRPPLSSSVRGVGNLVKGFWEKQVEATGRFPKLEIAAPIANPITNYTCACQIKTRAEYFELLVSRTTMNAALGRPEKWVHGTGRCGHPEP